MKTKLGASIGITLNLGNFENIKVETSIEIEKQLYEEDIEAEQEKITEILHKDLAKKIKAEHKKLYDRKKGLRAILEEKV